MLLSINPEHVENILRGEKVYEYRKKICKRKIDKIVIYSTFPIKQIVGEVEVLDVLEMDKKELWKITKEQSGITKRFYDQYYRDRKTAAAYKLGEVMKYDNPRSLEEIGVKVAPQSYMYLSDKVVVS